MRGKGVQKGGKVLREKRERNEEGREGGRE